MTTTPQLLADPLYGLKASLQDAARRGDAAFLADCLQGAHLPALGGELQEADLVYQALTLPPYDPDLPPQMAGLAAQLCATRAEQLASDLVVASRSEAMEVREAAASGVLPDEFYLIELFLLASYLPPEERLFEALVKFQDSADPQDILHAGTGRLVWQLRQALIYQQTDDRLEDHWFSLMTQPGQGASVLSAERRAELMDAWTGWLWLPEGASDSIRHLARGLLALAKTAAGTEDAPRLLRWAIGRMADAYPRSPEFWAENLGMAFLKAAPDYLQRLLVEQWPTYSRNLVGHLEPEEKGLWEKGEMTGAELSELQSELQQLGQRMQELLGRLQRLPMIRTRTGSESSGRGNKKAALPRWR